MIEHPDSDATITYVVAVQCPAKTFLQDLNMKLPKDTYYVYKMKLQSKFAPTKKDCSKTI